GVARRDGEGAIVAGQRLLVALERMQHGAAAVECFRVIRPCGERPLVTRQRLLVALEVLQNDTPIVVRIGMLRRRAYRAVIAREGLLEPPLAAQQRAAVVPGRGEVRVERERALVTAERAQMLAEIPQRIAMVVMCRRLLRQPCGGASQQVCRLLGAASLRHEDAEQCQRAGVIGLLREQRAGQRLGLRALTLAEESPGL